MKIDTLFKVQNQKIVFAPTKTQVDRFKATALKLTACAVVGGAIGLAYAANKNDTDPTK